MMKQLDPRRSIPYFDGTQIVMPGDLVDTDDTSDKFIEPVLGGARPIMAVLGNSPTGPNPTVPQGLPADAVQVGNKWLAPQGNGVWAEVVAATPSTDTVMAAQVQAQADQTAAAPTNEDVSNALDEQAADDGVDALSNAELRRELGEANVIYESDANKATLRQLVRDNRAKK